MDVRADSNPSEYVHLSGFSDTRYSPKLPKILLGSARRKNPSYLKKSIHFSVLFDFGKRKSLKTTSENLIKENSQTILALLLSICANSVK